MTQIKPSLKKLLLEKEKQKDAKHSAHVTSLSFILKKIAHPTRLAVIYLLEKQGELSVNKMVEILECEQSLLSHHLHELREIGLLKAERKGQHIFYSVTDKNFSTLLHTFDEYAVLRENMR